MRLLLRLRFGRSAERFDVSQPPPFAGEILERTNTVQLTPEPETTVRARFVLDLTRRGFCAWGYVVAETI